jgi:hypothetical protein
METNEAVPTSAGWATKAGGALGWIVLGAVVLVALGMAAPFFRSLYLEAKYHSVIFVFLAGGIGVALAQWRRGEKYSGSVGFVAVIAVAGAFLLDSFPSDAACERAANAYRSMLDRQYELTDQWNTCLQGDEVGSCSELVREENNLVEIQQKREALFGWIVDAC